MKILLVADGRSTTTRAWVRAVNRLGHQVILVTTYPCAPLDGVEADVTLPVAFSALGGSGAGNLATAQKTALRGMVTRARSLFLAARYLLGPLTLRYYGPRLRWLVERIQPDLVHAQRIPFEGMLAAYAPREVPLAVSIWGNDLTLHAAGSAQMAALTRRTLARADALIADAQRDVRLARAWGLDRTKPVLVVPGNGGIDLDEIKAVKQRVQAGQIPSAFDPGDSPLVINPRGFRTGSVRQDTFFQALPLILQRKPGIKFVCAAMAGQKEALNWISRLKLEGKVSLLPHLPQEQLWQLFARAQVSVSISQHDGTPNTLLETMAFGAFPIAGDIESLREWITPGSNGLLVEPASPQGLAEAVLLALDNPDLRRDAEVKNSLLIAERAEIGSVGEKIRLLYEVLSASREIPI
jgi:glycosyltransferase involved in cell wall biosynthesis